MRLLLPLVTLTATAVAQSCQPWKVRWQNAGTASLYPGQYDNGSQLCVYRNVRFASPPTQERGLRFVAPEYPPRGPYPATPDNPSCIQMSETTCIPKAGPLVRGSRECFGSYYGTQSEDCLFLDVWVPPGVFDGSLSSLPVVVWYYGGAYVFGSKTQYDPSTLPFYSGDGFVGTAQYQFGQSSDPTSMIFVTGNYRLGAFGWLAGDSFRKSGGRTNAGLLDQRAILRFVRDQIAGVGGDPDNVSAWGESAGASSVMHHLIMPENIKEPLFKKAILQSPAYQWLWDQRGTLDDTYTSFHRNVSQYYGNGKELCGPSQDPLDCLRFNSNVTTAVLSAVNQALFNDIACRGIMPVGPSVDGDIVPTLAPLAFYRGQVVDLDSIIVSHVDLEVPYSSSTSEFSFIPEPVRKAPNDPKAFDTFVQNVFAGPRSNPDLYAKVWSAINATYPSPPSIQYTDQIARAAAVIANSSFLCNTRNVINTYILNNKPVYAMDYAVLQDYKIDGHGVTLNGSTHGSDLLPAFSSPANANYTDFFSCFLPKEQQKFASDVAYEIQHDVAPYMQLYFDSHAIYGDPSYSLTCLLIPCWYQATNDETCTHDPDKGTCVGNLMKPKTSFVRYAFDDNSGQDSQTSNDTCKFWFDMAQLTWDLYQSGGSSSSGADGAEESTSNPLHDAAGRQFALDADQDRDVSVEL